MIKVSKTNPRYFTDSSGKAIYLAGSHTWSNFRDHGIKDPPDPFDYTGFLEFQKKYNHNFFRLWAQELPKSAQGRNDEVWYRSPFPWQRTGPGTATDGKPRFDMTKLDQTFFDRMHSRVASARDYGIFVCIMLFDGYGPQFARNPEDGFPYDKDNNINGIACGGKESQTLLDPDVTKLQEAYVKKVIDTVNNFDNVIYEIANEAGGYSKEWQYHMIRFIKEYEKTKPNQHPVGMTFQYDGGSNSDLFESPADWISPSGDMGYGYPHTDPPAADGSKVIINDTDHSFYYVGLKEQGLAEHRAWVWKNFTRGNSVAFMDPHLVVWSGRNAPEASKPDPYWDTIRINMGYTRLYAEKMDLNAMKPCNELSSTAYCLANPAAVNAEYLVYFPAGGSATVDLSGSIDELAVEWFNPGSGEVLQGKTVKGGANCLFTAPFEGDAVIYIYGQKH